MRFGSREICDVTFKTATKNQKVGKKTFKNAGQPVFVIDTATASTMSQETSVVYARGGKGYNNLIAWEGEKTMSFTVTDALLSPVGLGVLTGAGVIDNQREHFHVTLDATLDAAGKTYLEASEIISELGLDVTTKAVDICGDIPIYASVLDSVGSIVDYLDGVELKRDADDDFLWTATTAEHTSGKHDVEIDFGAAGANKTVKLDFYVVLAQGAATKIQITPDAFGGNFYVEADTLYRAQTGKDMAATLTFPNVKIQSAFEISMSATGDPSTFDFKMDAMPGYTYFDKTKKTVCDIQIIGTDAVTEDEDAHDLSDVEEHASKSGLEIMTAEWNDTANSVNVKVKTSKAATVTVDVVKDGAVVKTDTIDATPAGATKTIASAGVSGAGEVVIKATLGKETISKIATAK